MPLIVQRPATTLPVGWICARCGASLAPSVLVCVECGPDRGLEVVTK